MNMKTWTPRAAEIERNWYVVDAEGQTLGRLATKIATALLGKAKPTYADHMDTGDFVIVINAAKLVVTGDRLLSKRYHSHSGHPGGHREEGLGDLIQRKPTEAIRRAVKPDDRIVPTEPVVYGVDLARSLDYTVVVGLDAYRRIVTLERWQAPWAVTKQKVRDMVGPIPIVADATGVGDAIVADLQMMGVSVTPHVFTQPSKLRLMQRLVAAFQGDELHLPSTDSAKWLVAELETFEFTYTATGVKYEAPPGEHDDGVMALALALYGWDRVQGVVPEAPPGLRLLGDDPNIPENMNGTDRNSPMIGDFVSQLPGGW